MKWQNVLQDYKYYLKIERGLSTNSVVNYELDVEKLINYLEANSYSTSPIDIDYEDIQAFIYDISKHLNSRSQSRLISGLRSFFNYLVFEDYRKTNPLDQIESPKIGRKLPDTLSIKDIDKLIEAIDLTKEYNGVRIGERNRTILETIYSCGLRVSEAITLKLSDLFFEEGFIRVLGKGNKERYFS